MIGLLLRVAVLVAAILVMRVCDITRRFRSRVWNLIIKVVYVEIFFLEEKKEEEMARFACALLQYFYSLLIAYNDNDNSLVNTHSGRSIVLFFLVRQLKRSRTAYHRRLHDEPLLVRYRTFVWHLKTTQCCRLDVPRCNSKQDT